MLSKITFQTCTPGLEGLLADMRARSMRACLESLGRYDEERARNRLLVGFESQKCTILLLDETIIGFYYIDESNDLVHLKHLYVDLEFQGMGVGSFVLQKLKMYVDSNGKTIRLNALKGSSSNQFYMRNFFILERSDELDNYYYYHNQDGE